MVSPLFSDLDSPDAPSAISSDLYKKDGIYVGEAIIKRTLKNGKYRITTHDNRNFDSRAVFNIGENVLPTGIAVFCICYNGEGFIVGRVRATNDEAKDDGETDTDKSTTIGTEGDATLRSHTTKDDDATAEVTVTRGGVVKVRATGSTNMVLHPHGERLIQKCQTLLAFSDAYRIESGRVSTKGGVSLPALTTQEFKDKVGPARVEVRIKNGTVEGTTVHQFSVDTLTTAGGATTGVGNFKWTIDNTGTWQVLNTLGIKFGDVSNEPVVLGAQLVSLMKSLIAEMTAIRSSLATYTGALTTAGAAASAAIAAAVIPTPASNAAAIGALGSAMASAGPSTSSALTKSAATVTALQSTYLTSAGASKELILSDFFATQKIAPVPGVISE
jgi:hypothetical protein